MQKKPERKTSNVAGWLEVGNRRHQGGVLFFSPRPGWEQFLVVRSSAAATRSGRVKMVVRDTLINSNLPQ